MTNDVRLDQVKELGQTYQPATTVVLNHKWIDDIVVSISFQHQRRARYPTYVLDSDDSGLMLPAESTSSFHFEYHRQLCVCGVCHRRELPGFWNQ
jgi:hypothetical protein